MMDSSHYFRGGRNVDYKNLLKEVEESKIRLNQAKGGKPYIWKKYASNYNSSGDESFKNIVSARISCKNGGKSCSFEFPAVVDRTSNILKNIDERSCYLNSSDGIITGINCSSPVRYESSSGLTLVQKEVDSESKINWKRNNKLNNFCPELPKSKIHCINSVIPASKLHPSYTAEIVKKRQTKSRVRHKHFQKSFRRGPFSASISINEAKFDSLERCSSQTDTVKMTSLKIGNVKHAYVRSNQERLIPRDPGSESFRDGLFGLPGVLQKNILRPSHVSPRLSDAGMCPDEMRKILELANCSLNLTELDTLVPESARTKYIANMKKHLECIESDPFRKIGLSNISDFEDKETVLKDKNEVDHYVSTFLMKSRRNTIHLCNVQKFKKMLKDRMQRVSRSGGMYLVDGQSNIKKSSSNNQSIEKPASFRRFIPKSALKLAIDSMPVKDLRFHERATAWGSKMSNQMQQHTSNLVNEKRNTNFDSATIKSTTKDVNHDNQIIDNTDIYSPLSFLNVTNHNHINEKTKMNSKIYSTKFTQQSNKKDQKINRLMCINQPKFPNYYNMTLRTKLNEEKLSQSHNSVVNNFKSLKNIDLNEYVCGFNSRNTNVQEDEAEIGSEGEKEVLKTSEAVIDKEISNLKYITEKGCISLDEAMRIAQDTLNSTEVCMDEGASKLTTYEFTSPKTEQLMHIIERSPNPLSFSNRCELPEKNKDALFFGIDNISLTEMEPENSKFLEKTLNSHLEPCDISLLFSHNSNENKKADYELKEFLTSSHPNKGIIPSNAINATKILHERNKQLGALFLSPVKSPKSLLFPLKNFTPKNNNFNRNKDLNMYSFCNTDSQQSSQKGPILKNASLNIQSSQISIHSPRNSTSNLNFNKMAYTQVATALNNDKKQFQTPKKYTHFSSKNINLGNNSTNDVKLLKILRSTDTNISCPPHLNVPFSLLPPSLPPILPVSVKDPLRISSLSISSVKARARIYASQSFHFRRLARVLKGKLNWLPTRPNIYSFGNRQHRLKSISLLNNRSLKCVSKSTNFEGLQPYPRRRTVWGFPKSNSRLVELAKKVIWPREKTETSSTKGLYKVPTGEAVGNDVHETLNSIYLKHRLRRGRQTESSKDLFSTQDTSLLNNYGFLPKLSNSKRNSNEETEAIPQHRIALSAVSLPPSPSSTCSLWFPPEAEPLSPRAATSSSPPSTIRSFPSEAALDPRLYSHYEPVVVLTEGEQETTRSIIKDNIINASGNSPAAQYFSSKKLHTDHPHLILESSSDDELGSNVGINSPQRFNSIQHEHRFKIRKPKIPQHANHALNSGKINDEGARIPTVSEIRLRTTPLVNRLKKIFNLSKQKILIKNNLVLKDFKDEETSQSNTDVRMNEIKNPTKKLLSSVFESGATVPISSLESIWDRASKPGGDSRIAAPPKLRHLPVVSMKNSGVASIPPVVCFEEAARAKMNKIIKEREQKETFMALSDILDILFGSSRLDTMTSSGIISGLCSDSKPHSPPSNPLHSASPNSLRRGAASSNMIHDMIILARILAMSSGLNEFAHLIDSSLEKYNNKKKENDTRIDKNNLPQIKKGGLNMVSSSKPFKQKKNDPLVGIISHLATPLPLISGLTQKISVPFPFYEKLPEFSTFEDLSNRQNRNGIHMQSVTTLTPQGCRLISSFSNLLPSLSPLTVALRQHVIEAKQIIASAAQVRNQNHINAPVALPSLDLVSVSNGEESRRPSLDASSCEGEEIHELISIKSDLQTNKNNCHQTKPNESFGPCIKLNYRRRAHKIAKTNENVTLKPVAPPFSSMNPQIEKNYETEKKFSILKSREELKTRKLYDNKLTLKSCSSVIFGTSTIFDQNSSKQPSNSSNPSIINNFLINNRTDSNVGVSLTSTNGIGAVNLLGLNPNSFTPSSTYVKKNRLGFIKKNNSKRLNVKLSEQNALKTKLNGSLYQNSLNQPNISLSKNSSNDDVLKKSSMVRSANDIEDYQAFMSIWPLSNKTNMSVKPDSSSSITNSNNKFIDIHPAERSLNFNIVNQRTRERIRHIDLSIRKQVRILIQKRKLSMREYQLRMNAIGESVSLAQPEFILASINSSTLKANYSTDIIKTGKKSSCIDPSEPLESYLERLLHPLPLPPPSLPAWDLATPLKRLSPADRFLLNEILRKRKEYRLKIEAIASQKIRDDAERKSKKAQIILKRTKKEFDKVRSKSIDELSLVLVRMSRNRRLLLTPRRTIVGGGKEFAKLVSSLDLNLRAGPDGDSYFDDEGVEDRNFDNEQISVLSNKMSSLTTVASLFSKSMSQIVTRPDVGLKFIRDKTNKTIIADSKALEAQVSGFSSLMLTLADGRLRPIQAEVHLATCIHYLLSAGVAVDAAYFNRVVSLLRPSDLLFKRVRLMLFRLNQCLKLSIHSSTKTLKVIVNQLSSEGWIPKKIGAYNPNHPRNPLKTENLGQNVLSSNKYHLMSAEREEESVEEGIFSRCLEPEEEEIEDERMQSLQRDMQILSSGGFMASTMKVNSVFFLTPHERVSQALNEIQDFLEGKNLSTSIVQKASELSDLFPFQNPSSDSQHVNEAQRALFLEAIFVD